MQSEGRQQHMEPFSVSYSIRLHQHAQWLNSYKIFCYHILYFHPLSFRCSNKTGVCFVAPNRCQSESSQKCFLFKSAHISFSTQANTEEDTKQRHAFFSCFNPLLPGIFRDSISNYDTTASFHILSTHHYESS
jgi:hypothetical protein